MCVCIVPEYIVNPLWMTTDSMEERAESQAEDCRDKEEQEDQLLSILQTKKRML